MDVLLVEVIVSPMSLAIVDAEAEASRPIGSAPASNSTSSAESPAPESTFVVAAAVALVVAFALAEIPAATPDVLALDAAPRPIWDWIRMVPKTARIAEPVPTVAVAASLTIIAALGLASDTKPPPAADEVALLLVSLETAKTVTFPRLEVRSSEAPRVARLLVLIVFALAGALSAIAPAVPFEVVASDPVVMLVDLIAMLPFVVMDVSSPIVAAASRVVSEVAVVEPTATAPPVLAVPSLIAAWVDCAATCTSPEPASMTTLLPSEADVVFETVASEVEMPIATAPPWVPVV